MKKEIKLQIGDKVVIETPYGELFITIPYDDYNWNQKIIKFSSDKTLSITPQASNSLDLVLVNSNEVLNVIKLEGRG
jgi:hypothetical protein